MALAAAGKDSTWRGHIVTHHQRTAIRKDITTTARSVTVDSPDVEKDDTRGRHQAPVRVPDIVENDQTLTREGEVDPEDTKKITKKITKTADSRSLRKKARKRFIKKNEQQGQSVNENLYLDFYFSIERKIKIAEENVRERMLADGDDGFGWSEGRQAQQVFLFAALSRFRNFMEGFEAELLTKY